MKKEFMYKVKVKSQYGVQSLVLCRDKKKLEDELNSEKYKGFTIGNIDKSNKYYVTDGNNEIQVKVLCA